MKFAIHQPKFFPFIGYWQLINAVDTFVIFDDVNFVKKAFINHNYILINEEPKKFTLELVGASQNKLINEIRVGENSNKILKTIKICKLKHLKIGDCKTNSTFNLYKVAMLNSKQIIHY